MQSTKYYCQSQAVCVLWPVSWVTVVLLHTETDHSTWDTWDTTGHTWAMTHDNTYLPHTHAVTLDYYDNSFNTLNVNMGLLWVMKMSMLMILLLMYQLQHTLTHWTLLLHHHQLITDFTFSPAWTITQSTCVLPPHHQHHQHKYSIKSCFLYLCLWLFLENMR